MSRLPVFDDEMLMRAAYDALRADGPAALSLRRIAARLGVSEPALHKRIGSKHALLVRLQRWATDRTRALVAGLDAARDPVPALRELFRVYGRQAASAKTLAHLTAFSALCLADEKLRAPARERHRLLVDGIAAALRRARHRRPAATARAAVALLSGVPLGWATDPEASLEHALLEALDTLLTEDSDA
jgi:AcrR family transcriptional regulator